MNDMARSETTASEKTTVRDMIRYLESVEEKYGSDIRIIGSVDGGYNAGNPNSLSVDPRGDNGRGVVVIGFA